MKHLTTRRQFVKHSALVGAWLCSAGQSRSADDAPEFTQAEFEKLHKELQPPKDELWRSIPWKTSILDACKLAAQDKKPLVMRVRSGHPLGCVWNNGVIDRVSILSDPEIVNLLKTKFVPVAVDQHDHRKRKDSEGEFFAKILNQGKRDIDGYAQGFYLFTAQGKLLEFENTLSADRMKAMLTSALKKFDPAAEVPKIEEGQRDARFVYELPEGGLIVYVTSKVLGGYEPLEGLAAVRQQSLGRDHLWLRKDEAEALVKGELPESVQKRLARYHLIDNTRGETPMWRADEIKDLKITLQKGRLTGSVHLETKAGDRGYRAQLLGVVETTENKVTRLDAVAKGMFWGEGSFNRGAPKGKFPFAVALTLAGGKGEVMEVPPGGARGNLKGYLN